MAGVPAFRGQNGTAPLRNGRPDGAPNSSAKSWSDGFSPQRCNRRFRNGAATSLLGTPSSPSCSLRRSRRPAPPHDGCEGCRAAAGLNIASRMPTNRISGQLAKANSARLRPLIVDGALVNFALLPCWSARNFIPSHGLTGWRRAREFPIFLNHLNHLTHRRPFGIRVTSD